MFVRYQFMLYRHWNLYDSMWHSRYIATRLGIWKDHGKKYWQYLYLPHVILLSLPLRVLDTLLARVGLPLNKCMDSYATMDVKLKQDLKKNLLPYAKQIGLEGICYPSFIYVLLTLLLRHPFIDHSHVYYIAKRISKACFGCRQGLDRYSVTRPRYSICCK